MPPRSLPPISAPMVSVLGGADISWLVGLVVAGAAYLVSSRLTGATAQAEVEVGPTLRWS